MVKLSNHILRHRRLFPCLIVFFIISVSQMVVSSPLYAMSQQKQLLVINSYNESAPLGTGLHNPVYAGSGEKQGLDL